MSEIVNGIVNYIIGFMPEWFPEEIVIFLISCMPVLECRGGMIAVAAYQTAGVDISTIAGFIICFLGNILPVPFILLFIKKIFAFMKKHNILSKLVNKLETRTLAKRDKIDKYGPWGLLAFVAIPLPGTGGWTGSLLAALLNIKFSKAFPVIALGVLIADIIMTFGVSIVQSLLNLL